MLEIIETKRYIFNTKEIWFSEYPYDVENCHRVIFYDCKNFGVYEGFSCDEFDTLVIDLTQDLDVIWKNFNRKSCRQPINRAKKAGVQIKIGENHDEFYRIYRSFRKTKGLIGLKKLDLIKKYCTLFTVKVKGDILSGYGYLEDTDNMRAWITGSLRLSAKSKEIAYLIGNANRLLIWTAIQYAKEKGIKYFDLGGYYTGKDKKDPRYSINRFKKGFGGQVRKHYIYEKSYSNLYKNLRNLKKNVIYVYRSINKCNDEEIKSN
jgi:lipid II:glycine glycyltransferase (peptidoglycan interpeptide bridge formation enzyme)